MASFLQSKNWSPNFVYNNSRLVRISLLINISNKEFVSFSRGEVNWARVHLKGEAKNDGLPLTRTLTFLATGSCAWRQNEYETVSPSGVTGPGAASPGPWKDSYLVDPASSHMLVSKIKPCMSKYKH